MKFIPIPEEIAQYMSYNPTTGDLMWIAPVKNLKTPLHTPLTATPTKQYIAIKFKGKSYLGHRVAWFLHTGEQPSETIDHINEDGSDNRFLNLRIATISQNNCNRSKTRANTSGYKGVVKTGHSSWQATICKDRKSTHLGTFSSPELAYEAYCQAAEKLHQEFHNKG